MTKKLDIARVKKEAAEEVQREKLEKAKSQIKDKLRELDAAKKVVANLDRELEDLYDEIAQEE
ncbi:MAG: hypothetical protein ACYTEQ_03460 [Planctomycetota bacterium]|jgi:hypothetical protein